ncbi:hypothetical protein VKT23_001460 [Stygiomarasmius scandens]|uniref:Uncharacterized protein n=1 Tax=Marasmiellus scandens TaxID=2682957 RepID=A0ABR1JYX6_9AGAR
MNTISFLPELKTLVLSISSIPEDDWEMDNRTGVSWTNFQDIAVGFISLAYLDIRTTPPALLILLDAIPSNQLSGLVFTLENSTGENETSAETALQQVSVMFPKLAVKQPSIKSLSFTWSRGHFPVERENNDVHRWRSAFETLFSMSSLAKLTYHFPLLLDEQLVKEMAEAWSEMTDLRITSGDDSVYISTLSHFALNCPHLEVLDVPFIPFVLGDAPCDCSGLFAHPLKTLVAPYTDPENPEMTAKQLTRMFPYVGVIRREYTISPAWKEVQRILETDRVEKDTEPGV